MATCSSGNDYDGSLGTRISAIFVIGIGSLLGVYTFMIASVCWTNSHGSGAWFPVFARRRNLGVPEWAFFVAKYFGSGVIITTAFIHLLAPANEALGDECLADTAIGSYPWPEGIALMTIFVLFPLELMIMRYAHFGKPDERATGDSERRPSSLPTNIHGKESAFTGEHRHIDHTPGADHLGHAREHVDNADVSPDWEKQGLLPENYSAQLTAIFILEFGVIFHSIFIGLTLAVAGEEFTTLYIVLVFHQTFEGLGLGSRLASIPWPKSKRWTPYVLATAYGFTTPIAIAIGLGVRRTFAPGSANTLIVNGVFDSISAGILIYTGLVELMAHEFLFSTEMRTAPIRLVMSAFGLMTAGAGLMALLGYWA